MPVGGGHTGGHHGGGGGGGHHHHGGQHSPRFGYNHHQDYGYRKPLLYGRFRFAYWSLLVLIVFIIGGFVTGIIGLDKLLLSYYGYPTQYIDASPLDNRLLSYAQSTCQSIELTQEYIIYGEFIIYNVSLYLVETIPDVYDAVTLIIAEQTWKLFPGFSQNYNFYLLKNSVSTFSFYIDPSNSGGIAYYYIFNEQQFNRFEDSGSSSSYHKSTCSSTDSTRPCKVQFRVQSDGEYYFLLYNKNDYFSITIHNTITIDKYLYSLDDVIKYAECHTSYDSSTCNVNVPPSPTLYPIVTTSNVSSAGWTDSIYYSWRCTGKLNLEIEIILLLAIGGGAYAISIISTVFIIAIIFCIKRGFGCNPYSTTTQPLLTNNITTTTTATTTTTTPQDDTSPSYGSLAK